MKEFIYRYQFKKGAPMLEVELTLQLAVLAAECLHGEARVRLDGGYSISEEKLAIVVDAGTPVGRDICRIFTGLAIKEFGEDSFKVERIVRDREKENSRREAQHAV